MKMHYLRKIAATTCAAIPLICPVSANAAVDMFLKLTGVVGETRDDSHRGEIDVLAWSWGESGGTALTKKGLVPTACIQDISFTKYIDSASPDLIVKTISGQVINTATLTVRKPGASPLDFLIMNMTNVTVTSYSTGGSGGEDRLTENITLRFGSMAGTYNKQDPSGAITPVTWNISAQTTLGCR